MNTNISPHDLGLGGHTTSLNSLPGIVISTLFYFAGALAVIFVIIGGIQYVVSSGDPKKTAQAKNTIVYALVGLVLVAASGIVVRYIIGHL